MAYNEVMFAYMFGSRIPNHALQLPTFHASATQPWQRKAILNSLSVYWWDHHDGALPAKTCSLVKTVWMHATWTYLWNIPGFFAWLPWLPPAFLFPLYEFCGVLSSHELFLSLHGLLPMYLPFISRRALAPSTASEKLTKPYPACQQLQGCICCKTSGMLQLVATHQASCNMWPIVRVRVLSLYIPFMACLVPWNSIWVNNLLLKLNTQHNCRWLYWYALIMQMDFTML